MEHEYRTILKNLSLEEMSTIIYEIQNSGYFELDDLCHVVIKGTNKRIGYVGDEELQLVDPEDKSLEKYHKNLISIYQHAISEQKN